MATTSTGKTAARKTATKKAAARKAPPRKTATKKTAARKAPARKTATRKTAPRSSTNGQGIAKQVIATKRQAKASFGRLANDASGFASQVGNTAQAVAHTASMKAGSALRATRDYVRDHPAQAAAIASTAIAAVGAVATRKKWPGVARTAALAAPLAAGSRMLAEVASKVRK